MITSLPELISKGIGQLDPRLPQALGALIALATGTLLKGLQAHSHERRSAELTKRICSLSKSIHDLPQLSLPLDALPVGPQAALAAELKSAIHELTALQTRPSRGVAFSTFTAKMRSGLLLYRPKRLAAWTLHIVFYAYLICFLVFMWVGLSPDTPNPANPTMPPESFAFKVFLFVFVFVILGIPLLIIRFLAARIPDKQRGKKETAQGVAPANVNPVPEANPAPDTQRTVGQQA